MNYLAHAYLSMNDPEILTGNMIGDYVKGKKILETYPDKIRRGIMLHRSIDSFADTHPATQRAKVWFAKDYGLYSGAIIDILYDHFLANDPKHFSSKEALLDFSQHTYQQLEEHKEYMPTKFLNMLPRMKEHNWLYNYRTVHGAKRSLEGLVYRAKHMPDSTEAYQSFIMNYQQIAQSYYEFIDDIIKFVKTELRL